ncbi:MAG TPA: ImmA/IrrE family metallo-endopeptidase [Thermoleophilaceae bacterium]
MRALLADAPGKDPYAVITARAQALALDGLENGWSGPPFDPFELADLTGVETVPREDIEDARLVSPAEGQPRIEFNPQRRPARVRFSVAHELGHLLFPDHADQVRYRNQGHGADRRKDAWQLEVLCNVAAAELLMPIGSLPGSESEDLSLPHLLDLRATFGVSTEALLRRLVRLTSHTASMFAARRYDDGYRLDYVVDSHAWQSGLRPGAALGQETVLARCTAVGFSTDGVESWPGVDEPLIIQAVGIPTYPGDRYPRVVGLIQPETARERRASGIRYLRGDATDPQIDGPTIIAHVVNNAAQRWGGHGFAMALRERFPSAYTNYTTWASSSGNRRLGAVHLADAEPDVWVASLVAQAGYGDNPTPAPRLRLKALRDCLEALAGLALERKASVHMPPIGTGQAGMSWPPVRDLILDELVDRGIAATVYVLPHQPMPDETPPVKQPPLAGIV